MNEESCEPRALRPLWALTLGAAAGSGGAVAASVPVPTWLPLPVALVGAVLLFLAVRRGANTPAALWFLAGLAAVGGHGLQVAAGRHELASLIDREEPVWIRARLVVTEGWAEGRWGWRTRVRVLDAVQQQIEIPKLARCRLEVRGNVDPLDLSAPGAIVDAFVSIRGSPRSPLLVATSPRLIEATGNVRLLPILRGRLAHRLFEAAGTDVDRIRAAELAAALALGRRDLMSAERREGWRRSGYAHLLAVSGLHVGLVAGMAWLILSACRVSPTHARIALLLLLPTYALLAGASPSAVRAALMGMVYLGARLLGRATVPMAAVLLTAFVLLLFDPSLIAEVSFQLTVLLTAALVRWTPTISAAIPLPRWLSAAIAVPVIAQLAAAPLVAHHFATLIPGAAAANLLVPWLLAPVVLASVAATALAPLTAVVAGWLLTFVDLGCRTLWTTGSAGRAAALIPPTLTTPLLVWIGFVGLLSLLPGKSAKVGAVAYVVSLAAFSAWWLVIPPPARTEVELVPVSQGLCLRISAHGRNVLMDGGNSHREAVEMAASSRTRRYDAVIASHGDEDHISGLATVLGTTDVNLLMLPTWLRQSREIVPLLRAARRHGVRITPVARGSRIDLGGAALEVLWPPAVDPPRSENERSLVARFVADRGTVLLTADIGRATESRLATSSDLACTILVVPHHGSRYSASPAFLDAAAARFALIPAGPRNLHHHPHPEVLDRLVERGIPYRMPIRDGRCGVRWLDGDWRMFPEEVKE